MIEAGAQERLDLPPSLADGKVVRGKDGWLFLDNDSNRVIAQHTGELTFTEEQLEQWRYLLETRIAWLERAGAHYHFLVAPNAHSIYPDKLPDHVRGVAERPIHKLLAHLEAGGSYARIVYPLNELVAHRADSVHPKTSSRWSELGAFIAYQALMADVTKDVAVRVLTFDDVVMHGEARTGVLGHKVEPRQRSQYAYLDLREPRARLVHHNRVRNTGSRVEYESDGTLDCLVFGDSPSTRVIPFLAESFRHLVFAQMPNMDFSLVSELKPDLVVTITTERFLIQVPVDLPAPTQRLLEAKRLAAGDVIPPRPDDTNRIHSRRPSRAAAPS